MREKKFTAGSWIVKHWDGDEWPERRVSVGPENIAVMISPRYASDEQMKHDANLISAAPELLEACEFLTEVIQNLTDSIASGVLIKTPNSDNRAIKARLAIAKAYGE